MRAIRKEFSVIKNHKLLLATVTAIMIIPFLYSFFFLKSVWDPYASTGSLPVAVVNQDQAVTYRGKEFAVGQQLVKKLKKNDQMGWHFVTKEKADYGLSHKKYYMVITIPKNFSKNATTVLNTHPKKMDLTYTTNDSLNYIGAVMSEAAAKQLNTQIRQTVSTAYADTMFDAVKNMKKGFKTAASGSAKLADGSKVLTDGINTYTAGVSQVNDGVMTLQAGVLPLASGVNALATGANTLASGIGTYTNGVNQVNAGVGQLAQKTPALAAGVGQLASGASQLNTAVSNPNGDLQVGEQAIIDQLNQGLNVYAAGILDKVNKGVNKQITSIDTSSLSQQLAQQLTSQVVAGVKAQLATTMKNSGTQQVKQLTALRDSLQDIANEASNSQTPPATTPVTNNAAAANAQNSAKTAQSLVEGLEGVDSAKKAEIEAAINNTASQAQAAAGATSSQTTTTTPNNNAQVQAGLKQIIAQLDSNINAISNGDATNGMDQTMATMQATLEKELSSRIEAQLNAKIAQMSGQLDTSLNVKTLQPQISAANKQVTDKLQREGFAQINARLIAGTSQLSNGLWVLNGQIPTLTAGVNQLANGTGQLAANSGALNAGAGQLASGLGTLNSKVPTLSSGIGQLANGTNQLVANSPALTAGAGKIGAGNLQLSTALAGGVKKIDQINMNDENASMFAAPSNLKHKNYSYVPNYGHALAPYMLSVALYVGALVFNLVYPLKRIDFEDETPGEWFLAKTSIGALVATGNAVVEIGLMYLAGLKPDYFWATFFNAWLFSLAMMYLIMFLSVALDNPGRFLGMIILVLQLGGAGGSFPIQVTKGLNGFFQAINPYLPMTYSIYGFRESLTGGLGANQMLISYSVQIFVIILCLVLTYLAMMVMRPKVGYVRGVEKTE
ncbi:YhgE/Pip domain-containing protein [Ligilactobacillus equi]|uniref:YhgE/Pip domain-containing protein n=1 Tax=Ligilactobacillus equi TaxID=137357 RepID=UPI002ED305AC